MITKLKSYSKLMLNWISPIERYLKEVEMQGKFRVELDLIKGRHHNEDNHPSIIHFALNKAATQYTSNILTQCAVENGMVPVGIHGYAFNTNFPYLDHLSAEEMKNYQHIFKPKGYLYSVFGGMIEGISGLDKYRIILMIRDPRDALVSEYYSVAYSHGVPNKQGKKYKRFVKERAKARICTIDEYVVSESDRIYDTLQRYKTLLIDKYPNVYVTKYEEMINDFSGWLNNLLNTCVLNISHDLFTTLIEKNKRMRPTDENINIHMRKGIPGEYKEKLKRTTIEYLNAKFSPILLTFGYKLNGVH